MSVRLSNGDWKKMRDLGVGEIRQVVPVAGSRLLVTGRLSVLSWIGKLDPAGQGKGWEWRHEFQYCSEGGKLRLHSIAKTKDDAALLSGSCEGQSKNPYFLLQTKTNGETDWSHPIPMLARAAVPTSDGGVIAIGDTVKTDAQKKTTTTRLQLVKTDGTGQ